MIFKKIKSGTLAGKFPYVRFGSGKENLVIFPPLNDAVLPVTLVLLYLKWLFRCFERDFTVTLVSRKRNLPVGYSTQDMAADYAEIFKSEIGPAHVMGISLGGLIAQHFAIDYPQYVKKLVITAAAYSMGYEGLEFAKRWIPWARRGDWHKIYDDSVAITYNKAYRRVYSALKPFLRSFALRKMLKNPSDFIISGQAGMIHDTLEDLQNISAPTLILAGTKDRFFPEHLFHNMVPRIPLGQLYLVQGAGHGVYEEYKKECVRAIQNFLVYGEPERIPGRVWKPALKIAG